MAQKSTYWLKLTVPFWDKPAGTIRITTGEHAAQTVLWPALERLLPDYPDIKVELDINNGLSDIAAKRYAAGVRLGEQVARDMIAVRIGPDLRMAVVGTPSYLPLTHQRRW
jgi:DNA-binding transcriptional LysR family regulator